MNFSLPALLAIFAASLAVSGVFSLLETAFISQDRHRLRHRARQGDARAKIILRIMSHPERFLAAVLFCNNLANVLCASVGTLIAIRVLGDGALAITTTVVTGLILIFAEITPKVLGIRFGEKISAVSARLLQLLMALLAPILFIIGQAANLVLRLAGQRGNAMAAQAQLSADELRSVVEESSLFKSAHQGALLRILDMENTVAADIMAPRADIQGVNLELPPKELAEAVRGARFNFLPVYRRNLDELEGGVELASLLKRLGGDREADESLVSGLVEPPHFVQTRERVLNLVDFFRSKKAKGAFVVNEYGEVRGLVTPADISSAALGRFFSPAAEHGHTLMKKTAEGALLLDGSTPLRELREALSNEGGEGADALKSRANTVNGLLMEHLGDFPAAAACVEVDGVRFELMGVHAGGVRAVRVFFAKKKTPREEDGGDDGEENKNGGDNDAAKEE